jgi:uncharacterized membrane protein YhaH (DUF805 family)
MYWYRRCLEKYFVVQGRARRKEYWMFTLVMGGIYLLLAILESALGLFPDDGGLVIATIYELAMLIPGIAVGVRRMHDVDRSGWFILIPFYNLYLGVCDGTKGDNRFGSDPKGGAQGSSYQPVQPTTQQSVQPTTQQSAQPTTQQSAQPTTQQSAQRNPALDIRTVVHVTSAEAAQGCSASVTTNSGEVQVMVQPGTESGAHLKVTGGGYRQGDQAGDLWVRIMVTGDEG